MSWCRTPLVILDQFDDYQTRHRERFMARKTWLKPGRLCEQNGAWRDLRELLASATIHLVMVTRTDAALGLTSVQFIEPGTYRLDRLSSHFVGPLLAALAKGEGEQPVIGDPEYGWTTLLKRQHFPRLGAGAPARERRPEIKDRGRLTRSSVGRSTG